MSGPRRPNRKRCESRVTQSTTRPGPALERASAGVTSSCAAVAPLPRPSWWLNQTHELGRSSGPVSDRRIHTAPIDENAPSVGLGSSATETKTGNESCNFFKNLTLFYCPKLTDVTYE
jgi:hypothetical protein